MRISVYKPLTKVYKALSLNFNVAVVLLVWVGREL